MYIPKHNILARCQVVSWQRAFCACRFDAYTMSAARTAKRGILRIRSVLCGESCSAENHAAAENKGRTADHRGQKHSKGPVKICGIAYDRLRRFSSRFCGGRTVSPQHRFPSFGFRSEHLPSGATKELQNLCIGERIRSGQGRVCTIAANCYDEYISGKADTENPFREAAERI